MRGRRRRSRRVLVVGCRGRAMVGWLWWRWWCLPLGGRCREGVPPGLVVVSLLRRWVAEVWAPMPPSLGLSMSRWHRCFVSDRDGLIRGRGRRIRRGCRGADCAMGKRDGKLESGCGFVVSKDPGRFGTFRPGGSARGSMRYRYSGPPLDASVDSLPQLPHQVPQSKSEVGPPAPALIHLMPLTNP